MALLVRSFEEYPELEEFGTEHGWIFDRALGAVLVDVGQGWAMSGISDLANFLRTVVDPVRFRTIRAAWLRPELPLQEQLPALIHAEPLGDLFSADSSELMPVLNEEPSRAGSSPSSTPARWSCGGTSASCWTGR